MSTDKRARKRRGGSPKATKRKSKPATAKTKTRALKPGADQQRRNSGAFKPGNQWAWRPGQSGNPDGRPKSKTLSEAYREILAAQMPGDADGRSFAEVIAERMVRLVLAGQVQAAVEIRKATEGDKLAQEHRGRVEVAHDMDLIIEKVYGGEDDGEPSPPEPKETQAL